MTKALENDAKSDSWGVASSLAVFPLRRGGLWDKAVEIGVLTRSAAGQLP